MNGRSVVRGDLDASSAECGPARDKLCGISMTPETPYLQPPPAPPVHTSQHPDRSGWLIAFGLLHVLFGVFLGLLAAFTAIALTGALKNRPSNQPEISVLPVLFMYGGLGTFWIAMGIASAMKKNWARLTLLVVSGTWTAI